MKEFAVEIISCENGFIILEGNSLAVSKEYSMLRRKWVCEDEKQLGVLIEQLAKQIPPPDEDKK